MKKKPKLICKKCESVNTVIPIMSKDRQQTICVCMMCGNRFNKWKPPVFRNREGKICEQKDVFLNRGNAQMRKNKR